MQRITKRNEDGTISIDIENLLLERLAEYEDLGHDPNYLAELDDFYHYVMDGKTCHNCKKKKDCEYLPKRGGLIRWNCPHWERGSMTDEEAKKFERAWGDMEETTRKEVEDGNAD